MHSHLLFFPQPSSPCALHSPTARPCAFCTHLHPPAPSFWPVCQRQPASSSHLASSYRGKGAAGRGGGQYSALGAAVSMKHRRALSSERVQLYSEKNETAGVWGFFRRERGTGCGGAWGLGKGSEGMAPSEITLPGGAGRKIWKKRGGKQGQAGGGKEGEVGAAARWGYDQRQSGGAARWVGAQRQSGRASGAGQLGRAHAAAGRLRRSALVQGARWQLRRYAIAPGI